MKVVFIARHSRTSATTSRWWSGLAARGHAVHLAAEREEELGGRELVERVAAAHPQEVTVGSTPIRQWGRYRRVAARCAWGSTTCGTRTPLRHHAENPRARLRSDAAVRPAAGGAAGGAG